MFRTLPIETVHKDDRAKEEVRANLLVFVVTCALLRFIPIIARKIAF